MDYIYEYYAEMNKQYPLRKQPAQTPLSDWYAGKLFTKVTAYCAEEVRRQGDTPWHVQRMLEAWEYALRKSFYKPTKKDILEIGRLMDELNENGFRQYPISVGGETRPFETIERAITNWESAVEEGRLTPEEAYLEFEKIHPFGDGNGRTGKVLYNWLSKTLLDPIWPPDFFGGIENP